MKKSVLIALAWASGILATQAQVTLINANKDLEFVSAVGANKALFVSNIDNRLYVSDGTLAGTIQLSSTITYETTCGGIGNKVFFKGTSTAVGSELFATDGTAAGTVLLKDINPGATGSQIGNDAVLLNGFVYFTAVTAAEGREIWKTDGTTAGTTLLKDLVAGTGSSNTEANYNLFSSDSYLLFSAQTGGNGFELWKSDGTAAGTNLLADINPGAASSNAGTFFKLGNTVLFRALAAAYGTELWKTDGTTAGTVLVKDINPGVSTSSGVFSDYFYAFNGKAYFDAIGTNGEELWSTDGTTANTQQVKNIEPGTTGSINFLFNAITVGNKFIFPSSNLMGTRYELWQSDGTEAGTTRIKDFTDGGSYPIIMNTYSLYSGATQPLFQGNKFFLYATTAANGTELWMSDGTEAGTVLVKDLNPGIGDGLATPTFQYTQDAIYFAADDGLNGNEVWKSNGTASGTTLVADINPGAAASDPQLWPIFNGKLTLSAKNNSSAAPNLYVLNGTVSPLPVKLGDFTTTLLDGDGILRWNTLQEFNTREFIVQRSLDGIHFQNIGSVKAAGQSTIKTDYTFSDANVLQYGKETIYYRLQVMDKDGKMELTKVVTLVLSSTSWNVRLVNNPVQSTLQLTVTGSTATTSFRITDVSGNSYSTAVISGSGIIHIPVNDLPAGIYFLVTENGKLRKTEKFIKN